MTEDFDWNKGDRVARLKQYWADGLSCGQISRKFKGAASPAAVIGKVHRLKLPPRPARGHAKQVVKPPPRTIADRVVQLYPKTTALPVVKRPHPEAMRLEGGALIDTADLRDFHCRWPHGDVGHPGFHYCGHRPKAGSPYCEAHTLRASARGQREEQSPEQREEAAGLGRQAERQFARMWG